MVKTYLRYVLQDAFGLVTSPECNVAMAAGGSLAVTGALEAVLAWDVRRGVATKTLRPGPKPGSGSSDNFDVSANVTVVECGSRRAGLGASLDGDSVTPDTVCAAGYSDGVVRVWHVVKGEMVVSLTGHRRAVTALAFDPAGSRLASGSRDTDVIVWDLVAEAGLYRLKGHKDEVTAIRFLGGGAASGVSGASASGRLVSASKDTFLKVWDLATQHCVQTVVGHRSEVWDIDVSPSGDHVVSGSSDKMLRLWKVTSNAGADEAGDSEAAAGAGSGAAVAPMPAVFTADETTVLVPMGGVSRVANERVVSVGFSPDGSLVGCHGTGKSLEVWKVRSAKDSRKKLARRQKRLREKQRAQAAAAAEGAAAVAVADAAGGGGEDGEGADAAQAERDGARLDEVIASDVLEAVGVARSAHKMRSFAFLPPKASDPLAGAQVLVTLQNNMMEVYGVDAASGKPSKPSVGERTSAIALPGHRSAVRSCALSSDDMLLLTTAKGQVKVWNAATRKPIRTMASGFGLCCAFCPGDRYAVVGTKEGALQLFDLASGDCVEEHDEAHDGAVWSVAVRPDGRGMVTGGADKQVKFYDFDLVAVDGSEGDADGGAAAGAGAGAPAAAAGAKRLTLVHTRTLKMTDDVLAVQYSRTRKSDKLLLAVALLDNTVKVFFEDSLKFFLSLYGHRLPVMAMDISYDDTLLVSASADKNVKIWGLDFGDCHKSLFAHDDSVMAVKFVPGTHYFFTAGKDKLVKYWDADHFELILELDGHKAEVWCLAVTRSGDAVISASHDRSLRVWARTEEPVFLEEEREKREEALFERELREPDAADHAGGAAVSGTGEAGGMGMAAAESDRAGRRSETSVRAADSLLEALGLVDEESTKWTEHFKDRGSALDALSPKQRKAREALERRAAEGKLADDERRPEPLVEAPARNVLLMNKTPAKYLLGVLRAIKPADVEEALLLLPFPAALQLLGYLNYYLERGASVEFCAKASLFLLRMHQSQIVSSGDSAALGLVMGLKRSLHKRVVEAKDRVGFDLAGLQFSVDAMDTAVVMGDEGEGGGASGAGAGAGASADDDGGRAMTRGRKRPRLALF